MPYKKSTIVNIMYVMSVLVLVASMILRRSGTPTGLYWLGLLIYAAAEIYKRSGDKKED